MRKIWRMMVKLDTERSVTRGCVRVREAVLANCEEYIHCFVAARGRARQVHGAALCRVCGVS